MNIATFSSDLDRYGKVLQKDWNAFGEELASITDEVRSQVKKLIAQLEGNWPRSPLLANASLFKPLGLQSKEVPLTRALAWWFGCGRQPTELTQCSLAALLELIGLHAEHSGPSRWRVTAEEPIDGELGKGRLDILIGNEKHQIAIEAKVNAREGKGQLEKYGKALRKEHPGCKIHLVLLTLAGGGPKSHGKEPNDDVYALSYEMLLHKQLPILRKFEKQVECRDEVELGRMMWADIARMCDVHVTPRTDGDIFQLQHIIEAQLERKGTLNG